MPEALRCPAYFIACGIVTVRPTFIGCGAVAGPPTFVGCGAVGRTASQMRLRRHDSIAEIAELQRQIIHFLAHQGDGVLQRTALGTGFL